MENKKIVIIGAGIGGLSAGCYAAMKPVCRRSRHTGVRFNGEKHDKKYLPSGKEKIRD